MSSSASSGVDYQSLELVGEGAIADRSTCERVYAQLVSSSGNKAEVIHLWQLVLVLGSLGENNAPMRQLLANTYCQYCQRMRLSVTDEIASAVDYVTNVSACPASVQYYGVILLIPLFAARRECASYLKTVSNWSTPISLWMVKLWMPQTLDLN
jgi:hypothetical protein